MDLDLKSRRIVYQMSRELERTDVNDDFHMALLSLKMPEIDKKAGFDGYLKLQNEVKESLKNYMTHGQKSDLLSLLTGQQMKSLDHMLKKSNRNSDRESRKENEGEYSGESVVAKKVQVVEVAEIPRLPFEIPPLQVAELYDDLDDSEDVEWVSSQPGRSSSRIPEIPMEPVPKPISKKEPEKNVTFEAPKKIVSRARKIEKNDAQIQTDEVEKVEEEEEEKDEKPETAEIGTNCRILITPRVEEVEEPISHISPICSPISTVQSDISEGEVISGQPMKLIVVRPDGSIVPTPRAIEDDVYDGDYDADILIAKSSSSFGVAEVDMSISSAHSH